MPSSKVIHNPIHWSLLANELGVYGGLLALVGGILALGSDFERIEFAYFSLGVSLPILIVEWPRSRRPKGRTLPRFKQEYFAPIVRVLGPVAQNYFSRFVIWLALSIPMYLCLPTLLAGVCLTLSALIYLLAALKGERWLEMSAPSQPKLKTGAKMVAAPTRAPPRRPTDVNNFSCCQSYLLNHKFFFSIVIIIIKKLLCSFCCIVRSHPQRSTRIRK
eukprot:m.49981 g.49981  ORF g.49981 m.49981 type:complete len:218 (+) comp10879_c0_seq3:159-812(+)